MYVVSNIFWYIIVFKKHPEKKKKRFFFKYRSQQYPHGSSSFEIIKIIDAYNGTHKDL